MPHLTFDQYHRLGEQVARDLEPVQSYRKIGDALGITKQQTWHIAMVALGKLAHGLKQTFNED